MLNMGNIHGTLSFLYPLTTVGRDSLSLSWLSNAVTGVHYWHQQQIFLSAYTVNEQIHKRDCTCLTRFKTKIPLKIKWSALLTPCHTYIDHTISHLLEKERVDKDNKIKAKQQNSWKCKIFYESFQKRHEQWRTSSRLPDSGAVWAWFKLHRSISICRVCSSHGSVLEPVCTAVGCQSWSWCSSEANTVQHMI